MEKIGYIYKITSPSGKSYIGQTANFEKRMKAHSLNRRTTKLTGSIKKYGWEAHTKDILWKGECTDEQLNTLEVEFIKLYDTFHNGLNLTEGGGGTRGAKHSEEARVKMSLAGKLRPPRTEEHRRKISEALKGRTLPEEVRARLSVANKGKQLSEEHKAKISAAGKGRIHSDESKAKISAARKGKQLSEEHKAKISDTLKGKVGTWNGRKHSEESKQRMREGWKLRREVVILNKP